MTVPANDVNEGMSRDLYRERRLPAGDVVLAIRERGDPARPPVLLLHGYPDSQSVWDRVAGLLADEFHVISYDVRGAGQSGRPDANADYRLERLADDLRAVVDAVSPKRPVHLIAHDWGSIQAWEALGVADAGRRFASFLSISGPCIDHVGEYLRGLRQGAGQAPVRPFLDQLWRSWYILAFQLPALPELVWRAGLGRLWPKVLSLSEGIAVDSSPTQTEDGAAGPRLYRANVLARLRRPLPRTVDLPVTLLILRDDPHVSARLTRSLVEFQAARLPRLQVRELPGGHWMPLAQPGRLAELARAQVLAVEAARMP